LSATEAADRIRWIPNDDGKPYTAAHLGYASAGGTVLFRIYAPDKHSDPVWIVVSDLPGQDRHRWQGDDPDELKIVAGRWLEEFAASLGAVFRAPGLPPPNRGSMRDLTCGACGTEFGTNFDVDQIDCPECDARRCPHCGEWFGAES
jgi:DNA-directed RNA polymerase subunit RPC12/RpoP